MPFDPSQSVPLWTAVAAALACSLLAFGTGWLIRGRSAGWDPDRYEPTGPVTNLAERIEAESLISLDASTLMPAEAATAHEVDEVDEVDATRGTHWVHGAPAPGAARMIVAAPARPVEQIAQAGPAHQIGPVGATDAGEDDGAAVPAGPSAVPVVPEPVPPEPSALEARLLRSRAENARLRAELVRHRKALVDAGQRVRTVVAREREINRRLHAWCEQSHRVSKEKGRLIRAGQDQVDARLRLTRQLDLHMRHRAALLGSLDSTLRRTRRAQALGEARNAELRRELERLRAGVAEPASRN